jgi:xanthine/CO dehydrogenase XdhC/CoxF family maturation factor
MDLVGVQARTADAAMVVAAGGLSYYTIDGGKTWARR